MGLYHDLMGWNFPAGVTAPDIDGPADPIEVLGSEPDLSDWESEAPEAFDEARTECRRVVLEELKDDEVTALFEAPAAAVVELAAKVEHGMGRMLARQVRDRERWVRIWAIKNLGRLW